MGDEEVTTRFLGEGGGFSFSDQVDAVYMGSLPFFDRFFDGEDMVNLPVDGINYRRIVKVEGWIESGNPFAHICTGGALDFSIQRRTAEQSNQTLRG